MERCSTRALARPHLEQLRGKFLQRIYPEKIVAEQIKKVELKDRKTLIYKKENKSQEVTKRLG